MRCRRCGTELAETDLAYSAAWDRMKAVRFTCRNQRHRHNENPTCKDCYERDVREADWDAMQMHDWRYGRRG